MKYLPIFLLLQSCQFLSSPEAVRVEEEIILDIIEDLLEEVEK